MVIKTMHICQPNMQLQIGGNNEIVFHQPSSVQCSLLITPKDHLPCLLACVAG